MQRLLFCVVQLCAVRMDTSADLKKNPTGNQHAQRGRNEIDPESVPVAGAPLEPADAS